MPIEQAQRIAALQSGYQVQFELQMNAATSRNNYEYLDILDRAWTQSGLQRPSGGTVCDIGSASFWYAATLQAFFRPAQLIGVEVEGHRLFRDGRSRIDYASGYLKNLPNARFMVADYVDCEIRADLITLWFPFLTPAAILAWRLPLSLLAPERLIKRIYLNLAAGGLLVMVNHGMEEVDLSKKLCDAAGLRLLHRESGDGVLSGQRLRPALLSCWTRP
jgi:hypothetical protein